MSIETIAGDKREILAVHVGTVSYVSNKDGVGRIDAYQESGEMAYVPWLAISKGDKVWMRIPVHSVTGIEYAQETVEGLATGELGEPPVSCRPVPNLSGSPAKLQR